MVELRLTDKEIEVVKEEVVPRVQNALQTDLMAVILYGSCARGDYTADSDIDIALLTKCDRESAKNYNHVLADIATDFAMKHYQVLVLFVSHTMSFKRKKIGIHTIEILRRKDKLCSTKNQPNKPTIKRTNALSSKAAFAPVKR